MQENITADTFREIIARDREAVSDQIAGVIIRQIGDQRIGVAAESVVAVARVLLQHVGAHHNRVWPSVNTIADKTNLAGSTVRRALAYLIKTNVIQAAGDSFASLRPSRIHTRKPVSTYDVSGMAALVAPSIAELILRANQTGEKHT